MIPTQHFFDLLDDVLDWTEFPCCVTPMTRTVNVDLIVV